MERSRTRRRLGAAVVTSALVLAGCGVTTGDGADGVVTVDGPGVPASFGGEAGTLSLRASAKATAEATTAQMTMSIAMTDMPMLGDVEITADGQTDSATGRSRVVLDMGDMLSMFSGGDGTVEMVLDGDDAYVRSDLYNQLTGSDSEWFRAPADALESGDLTNSPQSDPSQYLAFLEQAGGEITEVGNEEIRGVQTRHLRTDIDLARLTEQAGVDSGEVEEFRSSLEELGLPEGFTMTLPTDVWVDEQGLVRRFRMVFDFASLVSSGGEASGDDLMGMDEVTMTIEFEMWGFGEPVDIEVPSPDQVSELDPSLLGDN